MRRGMRSLNATALINRDVNDDSAVGYVFEHVESDEPRRRRTRHEDRTNNQIRLRDGVVNHVCARCQRRNLGKKDVIELAQTIEIVVDDRYVGAHPDRNLCGVSSDHAAADDHYPRRGDAGYTAEQDAATA